MIWQMDLSYGILIAQILFNIFIGILGFFIKRSIDKTDQKFEEQGEQIEKAIQNCNCLQKEFLQFKVDVSNDFVRKIDYMNAMNRLDTKLENIKELIIKIVRDK